MQLDGTTIGALFGFLGIVVTAISGVFVATRTNRNEKTSAALQTLEATRDEAYEARILLRDERITQLKEELEDTKLELKLKIEELEADNDKLYAENRQLKGQV